MRRTGLALAVVFSSSLLSAADEASSGELAGAVSRLAAAMEHLSAAMEKQTSSAAAGRDGERVQVAVGILALRTRRVDRLQDELRQLGNEGDDIKSRMGEVRRLIDDLSTQLREKGPEANVAEAQHQADAVRSLALMEARISLLEERKAALQTDIDADLRKLSRLEAILDDWLKQQK